MKTHILIGIWLCGLLTALNCGIKEAIRYGGKEQQKEIVNRAIKATSAKDCYTQTELEIIIFGESQL